MLKAIFMTSTPRSHMFIFCLFDFYSRFTDDDCCIEAEMFEVKEKNIYSKKSRDGCVRFKNKSELQSSNPLPIANYELTIPTSFPLYLILACHGGEVGIVCL